jgi:predicted nuclease of predicted toxin-antitoxin system
MAQFLVDVNLPYYFSLWRNEDFIHQVDLGDSWTDDQIWQYAKENDLTIITKDADFSNRILLKEPPPKIIHMRIGNLKMREFFLLITQVWEQVKTLNKDYKLVNVFRDRIEGID